ncbi:SWIM zinc finger family protein [Halomicrobium sp. IBSBa]|uniref:SWIM zinc finger family protein n=1 Tax=Halomicrobium sp. IBSBa TaxID=2778916 RepID=UPI001FC9FF27|nr:SWIM zinc finger family protein [Halomicrobium sp. IBSBa]
MSIVEDVPAGPSPERIGGLPRFELPDDFTMSSSWKRAQETTDDGGPINGAERMVSLSDSDSYHRVVWALSGGSLRAECPCKGFHHRDWCAHLASLWWRWVRGQIEVTHIDTGRHYRTPPSWLSFDREDRSHVLEGLTPAELDAYLTCEWGDVGVREYARQTDRSPGTVGNQLRWAREKVGGQR